MKYILTVLWFATSLFLAQAQTFPTEIIIDNGVESKRINVLLMGDGFTDTEQNLFKTEASDVANKLLNESPYKQYKDFFNVAIVKVPSAESGTDHPADATDVTEPVFPAATKDTYFDGTFDGYKIHRLTIVNKQYKVYSVAAASYPSYDQILLLLNSTQYGGSGGEIATFTIHSAAAEIGIHEMGHSFAYLIDEYWAGDQYAHEGINMTAESDPTKVIWKSWVGIKGVGVYQHSGGGMASNWYRPHQSCKMRALNNPFCSVCVEGTIARIYSLVTPIDAFSPTTTTQNYTGDALDFSLDLVLPNPNTLKIKWDLDGQVVGTNVANISLSNFPESTSTLTATVTDTTTLSHKVGGFSFSTVWSIKNNTVAVETPMVKLFYRIYPNPTSDMLFIEFDGDFPNEETSVEIFSATGQQVFADNKTLLSKTILQVDVHDFPKGTYVLKIKRGSVVQSVPVIIGTD